MRLSREDREGIYRIEAAAAKTPHIVPLETREQSIGTRLCTVSPLALVRFMITWSSECVTSLLNNPNTTMGSPRTVLIDWFEKIRYEDKMKGRICTWKYRRDDSR